MTSLLDELLGPPVAFEELKHKPGRRRTLRAVGTRRRAIVKVYASDRAPVVARRVRALASGPDEPVVPEVLAVDEHRRTIVLSEVPGRPLREAVLAGDTPTCRRAGAALAGWHGAWRGRSPTPLRAHGVEREAEILERWATRAPEHIAGAVRRLAPNLLQPWPCPTVVHRDLYEEQVVLAERVGLIDLDDVSLGPPELDLGNLLAHIDLLALRAGRSLHLPADALLGGYRALADSLDDQLLGRCRQLTHLRLACIHDEPRLIDLRLTITRECEPDADG